MRKTVKDAGKTAEKAVKTVASEAVAKVEEVKEEVKAEVKKAAAKAPAAEKTAAEKTTTAKAASKTAAAKAPARKAAVKETVYLQYLGKEINEADLMKQVKEIWTKQLKKKAGDLKSVTLYLKPEENMAYYVINDDVTGSIEL
ncbi:MAG: DUF6465 family protein [Candidatus Choladocola sp.]|nr:DUF6465 family protein [Candidatus Choladocola sp.]